MYRISTGIEARDPSLSGTGKKFYRHFWSEDSMIAGTGFEKTPKEPTCFPRGMRRSRPKHETNRYVYRP